MEGNIEDILQNVLKDPSAMKKLMGVAENLMGENKTPDSAGSSSFKGEKEEADSIKHKPGNDERIALIRAIRPYLSEERRQTADNLAKMLKMLKAVDIGKLIKD